MVTQVIQVHTEPYRDDTGPMGSRKRYTSRGIPFELTENL